MYVTIVVSLELFGNFGHRFYVASNFYGTHGKYVWINKKIKYIRDVELISESLKTEEVKPRLCI